MQNIVRKENLNNILCFSYRRVIFLFWHTELFFFYYRPNKTNRRINWIIHHQKNNHLHSNCKNDQSQRTLTLFTISIKFQGSRCERNWEVGSWNPLDFSLKKKKQKTNLIAKRLKELPWRHFIKHFSWFFCAVNLWIRERNKLTALSQKYIADQSCFKSQLLKVRMYLQSTYPSWFAAYIICRFKYMYVLWFNLAGS